MNAQKPAPSAGHATEKPATAPATVPATVPAAQATEEKKKGQGRKPMTEEEKKIARERREKEKLSKASNEAGVFKFALSDKKGRAILALSRAITIKQNPQMTIHSLLMYICSDIIDKKILEDETALRAAILTTRELNYLEDKDLIEEIIKDIKAVNAETGRPANK